LSCLSVMIGWVGIDGFLWLFGMDKVEMY